jgi:hypothetical protein
VNNVSIEQEVKQYLERSGQRFVDNTAAFDALDFTILIDERAVFYLEVKEKRQPYNSANWPAFAPEGDLFILDDLTVRKCLGYAPRAGILVRDNTRASYYFFSVIDLALMPRLRVNRLIQRNAPELKGKWLINLQNGFRAATLIDAFAYLTGYLKDLPSILSDWHACYGDYVGETIGNGGTVRNPTHWENDIQATR